MPWALPLYTPPNRSDSIACYVERLLIYSQPSRLKKQVCVAKTTGGPLKLTFEDSVDDRREVTEPSASEEKSPKSGGGDSLSPLTTAAGRSGFP